MLLRLALKLLIPLLLFSACSPSDRQVVDKLNSLSYTYHYRSLDSTEQYALRVLSDHKVHHDAKAEAFNNLAFVLTARMQYDDASSYLDTISQITDNQLELLISYIQQMRLCQRRSHNREFYDFRQQALKALNRINEERGTLSDAQKRRLLYAESELAIVTSTYYYYVGLELKSIDALKCFKPDEIQQDTAQYLNYLYNVGAGGILTEGTQEEINQQEFEYLLRCLRISRQHNYPYFEANSLEALAEHLIDPISRERLLNDNMLALRFINVDDVYPDQLPLQLAETALCLFQQYGDVYQIAGAYRTLASCSRAQDNNASAIYYLERALSDTLINQAPDLVASIREQLSVVYAFMDDKVSSDINRNIYLDLQEQTRQDRSLEARASQLFNTVSRLNFMLLVLGVAILLLILLVLYLQLHFNFRKKSADTAENERMEELQEELNLCRLHIREDERRFLEQRAKISLVNSITPFIDRMIYEVSHTNLDKQYMRELTEKINEQNDLLTEWIQLRQGQLKLHIESFPLQPLFDFMAHSRKSFTLKGLNLTVHPTSSVVKADRVLTLFMLNTLADNSRKFTSSGGVVEISAIDNDDYVEISVSDTGKGMGEDELSHVFDRKPSEQFTHGFGLLNCRGIIEKYRKTSSLFSVCTIKAESVLGCGSRFFFRLPKGLTRLILVFLLFSSSLQAQQNVDNDYLTRASVYADSAYYSNVVGNHARALLYTNMCRNALNAYYHSSRPSDKDTLQFLGDLSAIPSEVNWLHQNIPLNYSIVLLMRNETAVAALALHQWNLYVYNNRIYTLLFKELSADTQLEDYCQRMERSQTNHTVAIILLVFILICILLSVGLLLLYAIHRRALRHQKQEDSIELLSDELRKEQMEEARLHVSNQVIDNCLSALKHETMYYPSRIRQLVENDDNEDLPEVISYYRDLYGMLSLQAQRQIDGAKLHLSRLEHDVWGDENMISYLMDILRKQCPSKKLQVEYYPKDDQYIGCTVMLPDVYSVSFLPSVAANIPYLICRQIIREHGEATRCRGCGIQAEPTDEGTRITIILPRYVCKTSK
jgi:signal transduction histidine kinase